MRRYCPFLILTLMLCTTAPAAAQAWDSPSFFSPRPGEDIGLYVLKVEGIDDIGISAIWRMEGNINLGVRAGIIGRDHYAIGAEFYRPLNLLGPQSPLLMSWILGVGATFNDVTMLRVPLGLSVGTSFGTPGSVLLTPYVHPRAALDVSAYDLPGGQEQTDTDVRFEIDLGADANLGESFVVRVGATIGESNVFGAGIAYRFSRRLIVR
ncbi:hypothetical protein BH23GEM9_BH23GEM9_14750 [soil metagenome]